MDAALKLPASAGADASTRFRDRDRFKLLKGGIDEYYGAFVSRRTCSSCATWSMRAAQAGTAPQRRSVGLTVLGACCRKAGLA